ncbi:MAG: hypothetical protein HQM13_22420 [SAR324 cluster bacterium]|nr:hypothetical protein [SAR324 cluster bacterium]
MNIKLKFGWLLLLLAAFLFSGCSEELITHAKGEPEPDITANEEKLSSLQHLENKGLTVAQYSTSAGRVPLPNDLILSSINGSRTAAGQSALNGMNPNIPIRIPFTGSVNVPDFDYSTDAGMGQAASWASNILIVPLGLSDAASADSETVSALQAAQAANPAAAAAAAAPFLALPSKDAAGNSISITLGGNTYTGKFKAVYQDSNYDLVLVPETTSSTANGTFAKGRKYAVIVKKSLKEGLIEDSLFAVLKSDEPLYVDTTVKDPLLVAQNTDLTSAMGLESLRQGITSILAATGLSKAEIAVLQTFTTDFSSSTETAGVNALVAAMNANASSVSSAASNSITWATATSISTTADNAFDFKSVFESAGAPVGSISKIVSGYYACQTFLNNTGSSTAPVWELDLLNRAASPGADCPNTTGAFQGKIQFWLSIPASTTGIVIYQHGITRNKDDFAAVANTFAGAGFATIAIDAWNHGTRTYEDADGDGSVESSTSSDASSPGDSGLSYIRPDDPALTTGYNIQTLADITQLTIMLKANSSLLAPLGLSVADGGPTLHFVGQSLGGIFGSMVAASGALPYTRMVLNVPGGDLTDIVLEGPSFSSSIKAAVANALGLQNPSADLNATMLGVELGTVHALMAGGVDPLYSANRAYPTNVLLQEIIGDATIPNSNTELLALSMGMTKMNDGNGAAASTATRVQWVLDPANYQASPTANPDGDPAGHGFLLDGKTTATTQGQLQALCYLATGNILDPSLVINPATCAQ